MTMLGRNMCGLPNFYLFIYFFNKVFLSKKQKNKVYRVVAKGS